MKRAYHANEIVKLLQDKHHEDVFVSECKNGPSTMGEHLRLDGWAMKKSWSSPLATGYEVKVTRSDFVRDTKWMGYLSLCNCLYFVTAPDIVTEAEIPAECGWITVSSTGARLMTKKKAPYRDVQIPESLFRYVLMCRARIGSEYDFEDRNASKRRFWESWLQEKQWNRELGYRVRRQLARVVEDALHENKSLKEKHEGYKEAREALKALGIDRWNMVSGHVQRAINRRMEKLKEVVPPEFLEQVETLAKAANGVALELRQTPDQERKAA